MLNVAGVRDRVGLTRKDIDNLVSWGHIVPAKVGARRMFGHEALCQMRLYHIAKGLMPPTITCGIGALIPKYLDEYPDAETISVWGEGGEWKLGESTPLEFIGLEFKANPFRLLMVPQ